MEQRVPHRPPPLVTEVPRSTTPSDRTTWECGLAAGQQLYTRLMSGAFFPTVREPTDRLGR